MEYWILSLGGVIMGLTSAFGFGVGYWPLGTLVDIEWACGWHSTGESECVSSV